MSVDEESSNFSSLLHTSFSLFKDGSIRDRNNRSWLVWNIADFNHWWLSLETIIGIPLGRKLMNSAADHEEWLLENDLKLPNSGFFKRKKQNLMLLQRWNQLGWGRFSKSMEILHSHLLAPVVSGFCLASIEKVSMSRQKVQWTQISSSEIHIEFKPDNRQIHPSPAAQSFPWSPNQADSFAESMTEMDLDIELRENGWAHAGESTCFLPAGFFSRIFNTVSLQSFAHHSSWKDAFRFSDVLDQGSSQALIVTCLSVEELLSRSERAIYIQNLESWDLLDSAYLSKFGFGTYLDISSIDEHGGVLFEIPNSVQFPFLIAWLIAFWQRGHGRKAKSELTHSSNRWFLKITSLLEYA